MSFNDNYYDVLHKSLDRIKNLGEVFTPESYVEDMLNLLCKANDKIWSDENTTFFEPCCGHGNIVIAIYKRKLKALYSKIKKNQTSAKAALYAVANTINSIWAIDIDQENIIQCRSRVLAQTLDFLKEKLGIKDNYILINKEKEFIAHLLCAINRHIHENETLSALSSRDNASNNVRNTKAGHGWYVKNKHKPIPFNESWVDYYKLHLKKKAPPQIYMEVIDILNSILSHDKVRYGQFCYLEMVITNNTHSINSKKTKSKKLFA